MTVAFCFHRRLLSFGLWNTALLGTRINRAVVRLPLGVVSVGDFCSEIEISAGLADGLAGLGAEVEVFAVVLVGEVFDTREGGD